MAVLSDADRRKLWSEFMSDSSRDRQGLGLTKADLRAAVDAVDQWVSDNAAAYNAAIPLPARTALTAKQKTRLLLAVARRRWEVD